MRNMVVVAVLVFSVSIIYVTASNAETCITTGQGYASFSEKHLQRIFDLMVSPRPGDERLLKETIQKYLAEGHIFTPKAGIEVHGWWFNPRAGILSVKPIGSSTEYWVLRECLSDCRSQD